MSVYRKAGQRTFTHECEGRGPHEITISWGGLEQGLIYPELDVAAHATCLACKEVYEPHDCKAALELDATHRCDDHTAGLVALPEPDADDLELRQLQLEKWTIEQKTLIENMQKLLDAGNLDEAHQRDARITLLTARRALASSSQPQGGKP